MHADIADVVAHYESSLEEDRLSAGMGALELVRTREILRRHLPAPPARILDVGGGTGVHADWLLADGHRVHLLDATPRHVDRAVDGLAGRGLTAEVADARRLSFPDDSFDVALVLGPLYHLHEHADRVLVLEEARRVVRPRGLVAVAAINRFASLFDGLVREFLFDRAFREIVRGDLARTGSPPRSSTGPSNWRRRSARWACRSSSSSASRASRDGSPTWITAGPMRQTGTSSSARPDSSRPNLRSSGSALICWQWPGRAATDDDRAVGETPSPPRQVHPAAPDQSTRRLTAPSQGPAGFSGPGSLVGGSSNR